LCILILTIAAPLTLLAEEPNPANLTRGTLLAPQAFRAAARKVLPAVVSIESFGGTNAAGGAVLPDAGEGPTTGVILSPDGYIITSTFNFVRQPPIITVVLPSGERKIAQLLGRDETRKICMLKIDGVKGLASPTIAPRKELRVGQWAVALGVGYGSRQSSLSAGIISATSRISTKAVQTDANLSPANYGGPLIDIEGRVIGICVPLSPQSADESSGAEWYDSGIGFAVPLAGLDPVIAAMKSGKTLQAPFLGIQANAAGEPPTGASVAEVLVDSPAAKAGLQVHDKLKSVGGTEILDPTHLASVIGRYVAGDDVEIVILRGEESMILHAQLSVAPPPKPTAKPAEESPPKPFPPDEKP
jgi:serine protease Do